MMLSDSHGFPVKEQIVEPVPFNDLSYQWRQIREETLPDLERLFVKGAFTLGPYVQAFESAAADYLGAKYAVGVNSGTSALHLALIAVGVGPGDKVLIPSLTFIATAWAVLYVGAIPILCDVDATSATIDVNDAENRVDDRTKAIIPVHLYGQPANMDEVRKFATRHHLAVIEDAAQAIGARYGGQSVGAIGELGCFSFYPGKNLGAAGEGGLVITDDAEKADRIRSLRHHAQVERYIHAEVGFNYRMEGIQGLVLSRKLPFLEGWTQQRRELALAYQERLSGLPLVLPSVVNDDHVYHLFVVRTKERNRLREYLLAHSIETGLHYPVPLHAQPCFGHLRDRRDDYPVTQRYAEECLSLPLYTGMTATQLDYVCDVIGRFFGNPQ
jgi:dTDP-4-amino-4,6-dideoxygalactose transaminase